MALASTDNTDVQKRSLYISNSVTIGTLYGISVGPGDPELLTVKGLRLLKQSPVVAFPAGVNGKPGFAQQIAAEWLRPEQIQLSLVFPFVHDSETLSQAWQTAANQVWQYLNQGQDVAFVCEGDVSFYSTFNYLAQMLQLIHPEVCVQAVPGVSSPMAAAAALGIPLTMRHQRFTVLPATYHMEELEKTLQWAEVVVLLKVSSVYRQVWALLQRLELLEQSYVVEWATLPQQVIHTHLQHQPDLELPYFSLMIIKTQ